ncbi:MAG: FliM/FliN family flagellar motor switch protein [Rhizobiales bacterium]|nr:FliM/FliN family flagellar motor switch protein [Hyphomicrobiales bacterium]
MADGGGSEHAARIVALINQAQSDRLESELRPFSPFFGGLADKLSAILASYSAGSIKCSVSRFGLEQVDTETLKPHGNAFRSTKGEFRLFLRSERAFDSLLCEVCFGGAGTELHGSEEQGRPPSRIEQFLRDMIFDAVHDGLPEIVRELADLHLDPVEEDPSKKKKGPAPTLKCVCVALLVNAFSLSAEMEFLVPLQDMESTFGGSKKRLTGPERSMGEVLSECQFEIVASLAPQDIGLDNILSLEVGSVLKLRATPAHPSLLHVEGVEIGRAHLSFSSQEIAVSLI